jgi:hypothetical protein
LRHHFVAVQAFAFACPKVPGRVGPFLRSPFLSHAKRGKTAAVPLTVAERNPLLNSGLAINSDRQFKKDKTSISTGCRKRGSVRLAQTWACLSRTTLSRWVRRTTTVDSELKIQRTRRWSTPKARRMRICGARPWLHLQRVEASGSESAVEPKH